MPQNTELEKLKAENARLIEVNKNLELEKRAAIRAAEVESRMLRDQLHKNSKRHKKKSKKTLQEVTRSIEPEPAPRLAIKLGTFRKKNGLFTFI